MSATSARAQPPAVRVGSGRLPNPLPSAGEVVASIRVPPEGGAFAVGEGAVWAMSDKTSTLMRIDPRRNAVVAHIKMSPSEDAAAGNGAVWISHPDENTVSRVDPKTNKVVATIPVRWRPLGIGVSPGAVWVAQSVGPSVTRIDPATNRVVAEIRVGPNRACCTERMGLTVHGDAVWVALSAANSIVHVDARTNKVVGRIRLGRFVPCAELAVGDRAVWIAGADCSNSIARVDVRTTRMTAELPAHHPVGLASAFGSIWVAVLFTGNVDRLDPRTGHVASRLQVGGFPVRLAVGFGSVWVNDDKGRVLRIRPD